MIFKRKIYNDLLKWKELSIGKSAALVEGARRIGKVQLLRNLRKMNMMII